MPNGRNLVLDTFSEVYHQLLPWRTHEFWDFGEHEPIPNSVYVIGRKQFVDHKAKIVSLLEDPGYKIFFDNAAEGSWTLSSQLQALALDDLARQGKIWIIGGADMESEYQCVPFDHFLACIFDYEENVLAIRRTDEIFDPREKPYEFLFLNGRSRPHRKYLFEKLKWQGLLDRALWTMLDGRPSLSRHFRLQNNGLNLMATVSPIQSLPDAYEYPVYRNKKIDLEPQQRRFIKHDLFGNTWGEIYLNPQAYIDTYFSLVTETICAESAFSFRTEKIAKVLAMGHPWVCAANSGFYKDLRNMGFQTFHGIIDESFDSQSDAQTRMDLIIHAVRDILASPTAFLVACESVCKYNQQHLLELGPRLRQEFPLRFFDFLDKNG
jgi:hypothetical protein